MRNLKQVGVCSHQDENVRSRNNRIRRNWSKGKADSVPSTGIKEFLGF